MKKRSTKTTQHAPRALQEHDLQTIKGGGGHDVVMEINRNLK